MKILEGVLHKLLKGGWIMEKWDFEKEVLQHEVKTRIKVTELNKPNIEKMAVAFINLLRK